MPIGVSYPGPLARDRERAIDDLEAIRTLGFNSIRVAVEWSDAEPARGQYQFDALDEMLTLAGQSGLKVMLQLSTASVPAWVLERYPDGRFVSKTQGGGPRTDRICLDHPGVRADVAAYVAAATARAARHASSFPRMALHRSWKRTAGWVVSLPAHSAPFPRLVKGDDRFCRAERSACDS